MADFIGRRYCEIRILLAAGWGDACLPLTFRYSSGRCEEAALVANNWYNRLPPTSQPPILGGAVAVRAGLDHLRNGALVDDGGGALFETILPVDPTEELQRVTIEPARGLFARRVTRVNLFAVTGMALKESPGARS